MNNNAKNKTKQIVGIGVMTAIIAVLSQITIPLPTHVPVTLQTFAVQDISLAGRAVLCLLWSMVCWALSVCPCLQAGQAVSPLS